MNAIDSYTWTKVRGREYVLRGSDGGDAGRLTLEGFCRTSARAAANGRSWTFERAGLLSPKLRVQDDGPSVPPFTGSLTFAGNCEITLGDGRRYRWKSMNCLRAERAWVGEDESPLVHFRPRAWFGGEQQIDVAGNVPRETAALLALLGGFLTILAANDAAASTAALIAVISAS